METTNNGAPSPEFRKLVAQLKEVYDSRPDFGSISLQAVFVNGELVRFERSRSESVKPSSSAGGKQYGLH
jgi:hypothetical protein